LYVIWNFLGFTTAGLPTFYCAQNWRGIKFDASFYDALGECFEQAIVQFRRNFIFNFVPLKGREMQRNLSTLLGAVIEQGSAIWFTIIYAECSFAFSEGYVLNFVK